MAGTRDTVSMNDTVLLLFNDGYRYFTPVHAKAFVPVPRGKGGVCSRAPLPPPPLV
jgi:hypothetical protein